LIIALIDNIKNLISKAKKPYQLEISWYGFLNGKKTINQQTN